jgi:hypothetical protein
MGGTADIRSIVFSTLSSYLVQLSGKMPLGEKQAQIQEGEGT